MRGKVFNQQSKIDVTNGTFPAPRLSATLLLCPPEPARPNTAAANANTPKRSVSAKSSAAFASRSSMSASAPTVSCTANPAAPPATTRRPISRQHCSCNARRSNYYCFLIFPEHPSHGIGDLTHGGIGLDRGQNSRHKILSRACRLFHLLHRFLPRPSIAPRAKGPHSLDLLRLQSRIDLL